MSTNVISATNLGPIANIEFALRGPGVTVLVAPNGSGKSILLDGVQAAAKGEGKLPLKDRAKKGSVEAFGATITIGGTCRHTGSFEVTNLEGKFDLALLVDPRLKSAAAADRARVKALVLLTNVQARPALFRSHQALTDFDGVVTSEALATDDVVEMAMKIKDCYDTAALVKERLSEREYGQATALIAPSDLDLDEESDAAVLQQAYNTARDEVTRLAQQQKNAANARDQVAKAERLLQELQGDALTAEQDHLREYVDSVDEKVASKNHKIAQLVAEVETLKGEIRQLHDNKVTYAAKLQAIIRQQSLVNDAKAVLASKELIASPHVDEIAAANDELLRAESAIELGSRIRAAKANARKVVQHRAAGKDAAALALVYRDAGKATDEVLSNSIQCKQLRIESDGKVARLVTDTQRGKSVPYHELSEGERWALAIEIGADHVGAGGLLVISQIGWEGIDGANRRAIHQHAIERGVYILTAEAASDPNATKEIIPMPFGGAMAPAQTPGDVVVKPEPATAVTADPLRGKQSPTGTVTAIPPEPVNRFDDDIPF